MESRIDGPLNTSVSTTCLSRMSVRFKFTNDLEYHSIPCDGLNISVRDLKRSIIRQNKLGKITDFDLGITNAMTNQPYNNEKELIREDAMLMFS